jgi:hypothetical protein
MRKTFTFLSVTLFAAHVFAQAGKPEKAAEPAKPADAAAKPAAPAAPAEHMGAPKPSEEITKMAKDMVGVWKCDGKMTMNGKEQKDTGKMVFTSELDGHFIGSRYESPKSKENPAGYKGKGMMGYDAASKTYTSVGHDNMGGMMMMTSKGWEGDTLTWTGKGKMMGMELENKETVTKKGPREVQVTGTSTGGGMTMSWESTCKK